MTKKLFEALRQKCLRFNIIFTQRLGLGEREDLFCRGGGERDLERRFRAGERRTGERRAGERRRR